MAALTKQEARLHEQACALVDLDRPLIEDEKDFVLDHWQESSTPTSRLAGAFFTPRALARELSIELLGMAGARILDIGAGTGRLAFAQRRLLAHRWSGEPPRRLVCLESDPAYVRVGRRVLPEATWVCADLLELPTLGLGAFDVAIGNPPFGAVPGRAAGAAYRGRRFKYHAIELAARVARYGVFLVPQQSAPFRYSGHPGMTWDADEEYVRFHDATGLTLEPGCGVDTTYCDQEWRGARPRAEIVTCDLTELRPPPPPADRGRRSQSAVPADLPLF